MREVVDSIVTIIGLGNMGSALARAFIEKECSVTVWNRSPEKAAPLQAKGAVLASNAAEAVAASPIVILCVTDYPAAQQIFSESGANFSGKLLIQLSHRNTTRSLCKRGMGSTASG